jgi:hypothetical protein
MSNPFDASLIDAGPIGAEVLAEQAGKVADLMQRPNALANAKLHADNEMRRLVMACNRTAWGTVAAEPRGPTAEEAAALLERLGAENREKLLGEARLAAAQRALIASMAEAQQQSLARLEAEQAELAQREADAQEWAAFEADDAAAKEQRFLAWRAGRRGKP